MTEVLSSQGRKQLSYTVHPLLFGVAPILYLFSQNIGELRAASLVRPLSVVTGVLLLILLLLSRSKYFDRHVLVLSTTVMLAFSYGFTKDLVFRLLSVLASFNGMIGARTPPEVLRHYDGRIALAVLLLIWTVICYRVYYRSVSRSAHDFLNVMAGTMVAISLLSIGFDALTTPRSPADVLTHFTLPERRPEERDRPLDIFYIVPDRYANNPVLLSYFGFDNRDFLRALSDRGFYIAGSAAANYLKTGHSLAASLNMQYINALSAIYGPNTGNWNPVFELIRDNEVQRLLRSEGYRYVHMGSWWPATTSNPHADVNLPGKQDRLAPFEQLLYDATPARAFLTRYRRWRGEVINTPECERIRTQLRALKGLGGNREPVFVFAHFLIPHTPMKFDANGNCIDGPSPRGSWETYKQAYVQQVKFLNSALLDVFDTMLENNPHDFIFIIQSDEGPFPQSYHLWGSELDWESVDYDDLVMKYGIINALYFPDRDYGGLNPRSSPVNNFRIVLNRLFGAQLPLLEDRAYIHKDGDHIFRFTEVTEIVSQAYSRELKSDSDHVSEH